MKNVLLSIVFVCSSSAFLFSSIREENYTGREPNYIRLKKRTIESSSECTIRNIRTQCANEHDNMQCVHEACSRCIVLIAATNPFAEYCYWMTSCVCAITGDPSCLEAISADCF